MTETNASATSGTTTGAGSTGNAAAGSTGNAADTAASASTASEEVRTASTPTNGDARTDTERDPAIDLLRALAIVGVVTGHWWVTAFVADSDGLAVASPLAAMPELAPASWVLQTLAAFFFAAGYAAAVTTRRARMRAATGAPAVGQRRGWLRIRVARLVAPVAQLLLFWLVTLGVLAAAGVPGQTLNVMVVLVVSPLWFLGVYMVLAALRPFVACLHNRWGARAAVLPVVGVAVADVVRYGADVTPGGSSELVPGAAVVGTVAAATAIGCGWWVPFQLGYAHAEGGLLRRRTATWLSIGGGCAGALLILLAGYPASMVGVPGADRSNLNPPSLLAIALGLVQIGLFLRGRALLCRLLNRARVARVVAWANAWALAIFLWHQSALLIVVCCCSRLGMASPGEGLVGVPDHAGWLLERLAWFPAAIAVLTVLLALFSRIALSQRGSPGEGVQCL